MKITDYTKQTSLVNDNVFLIDGDNGTKTILAHDLANALLALLTSKEQVAKLDMSDLNQILSISKTDKLLIGTSEGTKAISSNDFLFGILDACVSEKERRNIFRGKNLGTALTAAQKAEIKAGTFKGMFTGDYWEIGGRIWRIVDFDYWYGQGDIECITHHIVVMPDEQLYTAYMNESNITTGAYLNSKMYTENLANAKTLVNSAFGTDCILSHREYLANATTDGHASAGAWCDSTTELPNEPMMYGSYIFSAHGDGTFVPAIHTISKTQLALMAINPFFINPKRQSIWLRDVVSAGDFAFVSGYGGADANSASRAFGVRPVIGVTGGN